MLRFCSLFLIFCALAAAELERIEIRSRDSAGPDERLVGRAYFSVDPKLAANREIADIALATTNAEGKVEFSSFWYGVPGRAMPAAPCFSRW